MKRDRTSGFTIIEVLVALVIVGLVGTATTASILTASNFVGASKRYSQAVSLAQAALEDLRTQGYDQIENGNAESEDGFYTVNWDVETDPVLKSDGPQEKGMKLITVTVSWDWKGQEKTYELQTVYARVSPDF